MLINSKDKPEEPVTDMPLEYGYDLKFWRWVKSIELYIIKIRTELNFRIDKIGGGGGGGGGMAQYWAGITAVTDPNNYTCDIWSSRSSYVNADAAMEADKQVRVPEIVDEMAIGDSFGVEVADITDIDYICIQQMGAVG